MNIHYLCDTCERDRGTSLSRPKCHKGAIEYPIRALGFCPLYCPKDGAKMYIPPGFRQPQAPEYPTAQAPKGWSQEHILKRLQSEMCDRAKRCPGLLEKSGGCGGCVANLDADDFKNWLITELQK